MGEGQEVLGRAAAWAGEGLGVAVATVVSTWGSAPRPAGSLLAVNARGQFEGSVSGGCVEPAVIREALDTIADGKPRLLEYGVSQDRAWEVGLACGGTIQIYVERPSREAHAAILADLAAKRPVVVVTNLATGEARRVNPFDPPPDLPPDLAAAAREAATHDASTRLETAAGPVFLQVHNPPVRVLIVGAVHIAQSLAPMVRLCGYEAIVVDPRRAFAAPARFEGTALVAEWPDEAFARLAPDRRTAVVTMTHDPKIDDPALAAALRSDAFYIGALGSRKTQAARRERLLAQGFGPGDLARIQGPVGLPIGARTPGEIATAVLAQLVGALRGGGGRAEP